MNIIETKFDDLFVINYNSFKDNRGEFVKTIHEETFVNAGLAWKFTESFFSISKKNVIRGMHFQLNPSSHAKLVYVLAGKIMDVVLDIRNNSTTFGELFSIELSAEKRNAIYIGEGFAHGFLSLEEETIVEYHTTTSQNKEAEGGVKWNSFNYNWGITAPIVSDRDNSFQDFDIKKDYFI
jgi:dTDP-4-dehydrorhamnose 3,5-epimerase